MKADVQGCCHRQVSDLTLPCFQLDCRSHGFSLDLKEIEGDDSSLDSQMIASIVKK